MTWKVLGLAAVLCTFFGAEFVAAPPASAKATIDPCAPRMAANIPRRRTGEPNGKTFGDRIAGASGEQRDAAVKTALLHGNVPTFLRQLRPIILGAAGQGPTIVLCVTPDYLAIGSDTNFLRVPMGLPAAMAVASEFGFVLPTRKMVDAIYEQADIQLRPEPMPPTAAMVTTAYFQRHNRDIEAQRRSRGAELGVLTAGHKKDLVLTPRLWSKPGRVAIYGWHRPNGRAIQPLSTVHGADYADYSHGVRLVSTTVSVDGKLRSIFDVLSDPALAPLLSDEGPMPNLSKLVVASGGVAVEPATVRLSSANIRPAARP